MKEKAALRRVWRPERAGKMFRKTGFVPIAEQAKKILK
jgi:hypothetical protein